MGESEIDVNAALSDTRVYITRACTKQKRLRYLSRPVSQAQRPSCTTANSKHMHGNRSTGAARTSQLRDENKNRTRVQKRETEARCLANDLLINNSDKSNSYLARSRIVKPNCYCACVARTYNRLYIRQRGTNGIEISRKEEVLRVNEGITCTDDNAMRSLCIDIATTCVFLSAFIKITSYGENR
ncbi:uncharacterized protein LOC113465129 [Ceratina calcarata]|uniref:Uncharacterized protein LOC113465129 n=1 Tax=Ceratina calcarata TaxID=156304 RepID=A0AAJ7SAX4_9HYME|nr:uncharacterized protein LOC113465129 [Ceratina calcarata]